MYTRYASLSVHALKFDTLIYKRNTFFQDEIHTTDNDGGGDKRTSGAASSPERNADGRKH